MADDGIQLFEQLMRFRPDGLSANAWAVRAGVSRTIWADLRRHGNPSRRTLAKLLEAAGSSLAEFEALWVGPPAAVPVSIQLAENGREWRAAPLAGVPLLAAGSAGEWGEPGSGIELHSIDRSRVVGKVDRPAALAADRDAYAVTIVGEAMWPRFRTGRRLLVSPAAATDIGDDVLVELAGGRALIKELVRRSATLVELRQFNPDATFRIDVSEVVAIHKVVGEAF